MAKSKNVERKAKIEQMRREQQRKERRRSMAILGGSALVVVVILAAAIIPYVKNLREDKRINDTALTQIGTPLAQAGCSPQKKKDASGSGQHVPPPTPIHYPDAPPAFGKHWGNFLTGSEIRTFYSPSDRPQLERMVHSLEHGHTIIWYDDTVKPGSAAYRSLQQITDKLGLDSYVMAAPWTAKDGAKLPAGKHVVLTHWTGPEKQKGVWQYCAKPSGAAVQSFVKDYPKDDAPEPGAA